MTANGTGSRRILTICEGGNVRSVAAAFVLKELGHQAMPIGHRFSKDETFRMMLDWADDVLPMCASAKNAIPEEYKSKITFMDVGDDRWGNAFNPELQTIVRSKVHEWLDLPFVKPATNGQKPDAWWRRILKPFRPKRRLAPWVTLKQRERSAGIAHCTPSKGAVSMWWAKSAMGAQWVNNTPRLPFWVEDDIGNEIACTRNKIVSMIQATESPKLEIPYAFWHDDDVVCISPLILQQLLATMLRTQADIVSGVYFTKSQVPFPLIFPERLRGVADFEPDRLYDCWGCGMGLTLVRTSVYRRMQEEIELGKDSMGNPQWYKTPGKDEPPRLIDGIWDLGGTEDLYFCEHAAQLGMKVVVDSNMHAFGFHYDLFGNYGPAKVAYPRPQWDEYRNPPDGCPKLTWKTREGDVVWR